MLKIKKRLTTIAVAGAAAAVASATLSAVPASASNYAPCRNRTDLLKIWYHWGSKSTGVAHATACFANRGTIAASNLSYGVVVISIDKIETGNNRVRIVHFNGDNQILDKGKTLRPKAPGSIKEFIILPPIPKRPPVPAPFPGRAR